MVLFKVNKMCPRTVYSLSLLYSLLLGWVTLMVSRMLFQDSFVAVNKTPVDTLSTLRSVAHQQRCYFQLLDAADQELQEATEQPVLVSLLLP